MPEISSNKPYRIGRSKTGLGLFATQKIKKGTKIIRYFGPMLDSKNKKHDDIDNKYLFEINNRWTIDGSVRKNIARYINHACRPNAESDVNSRKRKVVIRAIKTIQPGEEINYDYGTDYFKIFLKPIGCKCDHCEKKRAKKRAEDRAEKLRLKLKAEKKAAKEALKNGKKADKSLKKVVKAAKSKSLKSKAAPKRKTVVGGARTGVKANPHARGTGKPTKTKSARTRPLSQIVQAQSPNRPSRASST
ncbi:MAG: SET domain-containing protein [Candidatus Afipia apatlaquensis]|uniref:SET domain-containing protein n=1 Tax=Candidatus Afipia apatlaquensis TaxID=2712852 RepID=A0A7C9RI15_9BRAD|nr:SET domain-containing protein [Candidatus Afipia apatlaquensis]